MKIEISNGELVDKVTILHIKLQKIKSEDKLVNIRNEYNLLYNSISELGIEEKSEEFARLLEVNLKLWEIEDRIRIKEAAGEFDKEFIELARSVYFENDKRSEIKKTINQKTGSQLFEEKEYVDYKAGKV